jgi:hypothetical protein
MRIWKVTSWGPSYVLLFTKYYDTDWRKEDDIDGTYITDGMDKKRIKSFVGKPEEKKLPGILAYKWDDNIKLHLKEIGRKGVAWIDLIQDSVRYLAPVNTEIRLL